MKYFWVCTVAVMVCLLTLLSFPTDLLADSPAIKSIEFKRAGEQDLVALQLNTEIEPKIFEIPGEKPRIVLDFINTVYPLKNNTTIPADGEYVRQIRVGRHAEPIAKTRVVIDMIAGIDYSFAKEFNVSERTLSIIISHIAGDEISEIEPIDLRGAAEAIEGDPGKQVEPRERQQQKDDESEPRDQRQEANDDSEPVLESSPVKEQMVLETIEETKADPSPQKPFSSGDAGDNDNIQPDKLQEPEIVLFDVNYEKSTNGKEMVLFRLNGFFPPVVYSSEGSDLYVVCDFLDAVQADDLDPPVNSGADYIRNINITEYEEPQKVRVVIELFKTYDYDLKQVFFKEDNLFVIILSSLGEKKN